MNIEKLRRNQPKEEVVAEVEPVAAEEVVAEEVSTEAEAIAEVIVEEQTPEVAEEVSVEEIAEAEVAESPDITSGLIITSAPKDCAHSIVLSSSVETTILLKPEALAKAME